MHMASTLKRYKRGWSEMLTLLSSLAHNSPAPLARGSHREQFLLPNSKYSALASTGPGPVAEHSGFMIILHLLVM